MQLQALTVLQENDRGRDFIVGDLHGCYDALMRQLDARGFDPAADRLLSVGDLVDRGPDSRRCLQLVREPWFHSVWGNHEDLMLRGLATSRNSPDFRLWMLNGGDWVLEADRDDLKQRITAHAAAASLAMEIPVAGQRVGVVHAEVPGDRWACWTPPLSDEDRQYAIWGRTTLTNVIRGQPAPPVSGIDHVFFGHTPLAAPTHLANRFYIDTGGGYPGGEPTLFELTEVINRNLGSSPEPFRPTY
ncbi:metallophosphoesterase [Marinobacter sp. OP 3.4]|uniref:metallophosphoesterase n=1 Tax=Marinobacter sp. OP 3.4 TaxID=3076501 RepID=UPI002E231AAD